MKAAFTTCVDHVPVPEDVAPEDLRRRLQALKPHYDGNAEPGEWNRVPGDFFPIRVSGNRLILMGRDETYDAWVRRTQNVGWVYGGNFSPLETYQAIGTSYAVSSFLEDHCGVRWYFPGDIGEVVPKQTTLTVPSMRVRRWI